jgi:UPF0755 protein
MRKLRLLALIAITLAVGIAGVLWLQRQFVAPGPSTAATRVNVESGTTVRGVLAQLEAQGVIESSRAVEIHLRLHGRQPQIKAGVYEIPSRASPAEILGKLEEGSVVLEQLTVVEGSTFAQLRQALERHPHVISALKGKSDAEVMMAIGRGGQAPEGRFFPDTYRFAARTTDVEILKLAYGKMQQLLDTAWGSRRPGLPLRTADEALILASIVEKETGLASERARIAGVFITRLRKGMRLQSDPTVIYGIGEKYDGDIRTRDLSADTPYNTYTRAGLPPTPIALPGKDSVLATVQPDETGAIFFVATGDGSGAHYFSKTLEEHNEAVKRYLARLRQQASGGS